MWLTCGVELHEAARRLGVHYHTAYRWVREGSLAAVKRGSTYEIEPDEVERRRAARHAPAPPPRVTVVRDWSPQVARLYDALSAGDELAARAVVDRLTDGGIGPVAVITELLTPALQEIGARWASGSLSIAEEHRASAICERLLARIAPLALLHRRRLTPFRPRERHGVERLWGQAEGFGDGDLSRIGQRVQLSLLLLDLEPRLLRADEFAGRVLSGRHPLLLDGNQSILGLRQPIEQSQAPLRCLRIRQRRRQATAHRPGLIHQLQAGIAGLESRDLHLETPPFGRAQQPIQTESIEPGVRLAVRAIFGLER